MPSIAIRHPVCSATSTRHALVPKRLHNGSSPAFSTAGPSQHRQSCSRSRSGKNCRRTAHRDRASRRHGLSGQCPSGRARAAVDSTALMMLGSASGLNIKIDLDETDLSRFDSKVGATASRHTPTPAEHDLSFVRIIPIVVPKKTLAARYPRPASDLPVA